MEVRDSIYCFEIARRSVGRAALHLGIENMSETALDVMADVLLNYLHRMGRTLSHLAETNGRTSAHVNLLDALRTCEMEAAPAVQQMHLRDPNTDDSLYHKPNISSNSQNLTTNANSRDWKGLACFLFGPKWLEEDEKPAEQVAQASAGGGKQFPKAAESNKARGWQAPYPDEIPHFPQASETCANPHPLDAKQILSLHSGEADDGKLQTAGDEEATLQGIPDDAFIESSWGSMASKKRKKLEDEDVVMADADKEQSPASKKTKLNEGNADAAKAEENAETEKKDENEPKEEETKETTEEEPDSHPHVPSFYPQPPSFIGSGPEGSIKVLDVDAIAEGSAPEDKVEYSHQVRSSLVQLGSYWGSGWDAEPNTKLAVPVGRVEAQPVSSSIVPLGRASGSRVSRILEGSLDAAAMQ
mmetsp:Transcript_20594/g.50573  ORF Transcript_20594/g.50573 Transcript_20594/m.50573 type:complete len:415 (+) Transcript_20594:65-1309(+)